MPPTLDTPALKASLAHVYWIGGAPDAGKTTVARLLADRHALQLYVLDAAMKAHWERSTPDAQPELTAFQRLTMDERWVRPDPQAMANQTLCIGAERVALAVEDLLALPRDRPILAEGPWFFPELVFPLLADPRRAIWLVPTDTFKRASAARRDKPTIRHETSDPDRATRNWLARDLLLDSHVREQAASRRLTLLEVDGTRSPEDMATLLAAHFQLTPLEPSPRPRHHSAALQMIQRDPLERRSRRWPAVGRVPALPRRRTAPYRSPERRSP